MEYNIFIPDYDKDEEYCKAEWLDNIEYESKEESNENNEEFNWFEETGEFNLYPYQLESDYGVSIFFMEEGEEIYAEEIEAACCCFEPLIGCPAFFEDFTMGLDDQNIVDILCGDNGYVGVSDSLLKYYQTLILKT